MLQGMNNLALGTQKALRVTFGLLREEYKQGITDPMMTYYLFQEVSKINPFSIAK